MSKKYYVQDARQHVGNSMLWWAKDSKGYVCDVRKAHVFTEGEVTHMRDTGRPWEKEYIDARISHHIDMQHCDPDFSGVDPKALKPPTLEQSEIKYVYHIGDLLTCKHCDKEIQYTGMAWRHTGSVNPRHGGEPKIGGVR